MPHIIVETNELIRCQINWRACFKAMHLELSAKGYGNLSDFKSRVLLSTDWMIADQENSEGVIYATLHTMNPRPDKVLMEMAGIIHSHIEEEAKALRTKNWIQCCVRVQATTKHHYIKSHINSPATLQQEFVYTA